MGVVLICHTPFEVMETHKEKEQDISGSDLGVAEEEAPLAVFHEAHFVPLREQSNVYGLLSLQIGGLNKLVVATFRGQLFCLEFHKPSILRPPSLQPISFTYIPADAEVISIDALVKEPNGVVIGVTLVKTDSDPKEFYLNLYGVHCDPKAPFKWENIAEDWQPLNLKFIPFQLTHTKILEDGCWESVFLLSGDDLTVHLYREKLLSELCFQEEPSEVFFPEFHDLPSSITYMDIKMVGTQRLTAFGCQNGFFKLTLVDVTSNSVLKVWDTHMIDGPITSLNLFTASSNKANGNEDLGSYHLLVCSAVEIGVVFMNVLQCDFTRSFILPSSHRHDSVLCSTVADVTWDGKNELILGTYGKQIMVYRLQEQETTDSSESSTHKISEFKLLWQHGFAHPIHCVWYGDLTHDGLQELVVVSIGGVHILQHDLHQASAHCLKRLLPPSAADETIASTPTHNDTDSTTADCASATSVT